MRNAVDALRRVRRNMTPSRPPVPSPPLLIHLTYISQISLLDLRQGVSLTQTTRILFENLLGACMHFIVVKDVQAGG
jgi:hypothetical protein